MTFEPGDILLAAADVDDSNIDLRNHRGEGRILHLAADFSAKGEIRTGIEGLLVGLARNASTGILYGADPTAKKVVKITPDGDVKVLDELAGQAFGTVAIREDGAMFLGLHSHRGSKPNDPDGPNKLVQVSADGAVLDSFDVRTDGGHTGWHGVTSIAFRPGTPNVYTLSEGGRSVFGYDLQARRPTAPLIELEKHGDDRAFGLARHSDGRYFVAIGHSILVLNVDGSIVAAWPCASERGWTRVTPGVDPSIVYVSNFLEGLLERRDAHTGAVLAAHDINRKCSLCGLVEIP